MSLANELEQLMLNLINQERTNANVAPLTFNNDLNEASEDHSTWMLDTDTFSHTGQNGSSAGDRIVDAGYELEGNWTWGENIGWQSERGEPGLEDDVRDVHESLMNSPGHRANILSADYEEIGIGIEAGDFENFDSVMVTQNFGTTDAVSDDQDEEEPPVTDGPVDDVPDEEEPPVTEGPDEEVPEEEEPPVAEGPDDEIPEEEEPPVAEGPNEEKFDVEQFLADISDMLADIFDSFDFIASNDCDPTDSEGEMPMVVDVSSEDDQMEEDDMDITCGDWSADEFDFQVSVEFTFNFDLA